MFKNKLKSMKGFGLIEVLVALALIGIVGVAIISSLGTASKALITTDERETAKNIAELQMEYIKNLQYANSYPPSNNIAADYPGYSIVTEGDGKIAAQAINSRTDGNIQKITITVLHGSKQILTLVGEKTR
jgi:prepilin-type N-terminal cleavage/methylation domain-containing protein